MHTAYQRLELCVSPLSTFATVLDMHAHCLSKVRVMCESVEYFPNSTGRVLYAHSLSKVRVACESNEYFNSLWLMKHFSQGFLFLCFGELSGFLLFWLFWG